MMKVDEKAGKKHVYSPQSVNYSQFSSPLINNHRYNFAGIKNRIGSSEYRTSQWLRRIGRATNGTNPDRRYFTRAKTTRKKKYDSCA